MVLDILLIALGFASVIVGFIGCVLPIIPGPALSYIALILVSIMRDWEAFSPVFLIIMAVITAVVTLLDYFLPVITSKKKGASKAGIWGSVIGMIVGIFILPPFGMLIFTFLGAVAGELIFSKDKRNALRAGWGVFLGTMLAIILKLAVSGTIFYFFVKALGAG